MSNILVRPELGVGVNWPTTAYDYIRVTQETIPAADGGDFTKDGWRDRTLTTERTDTAGICSLAASVMTVQPGRYICFAVCMAYQVDGHQARLYDNTAAAALLYGTTAMSPAADGCNTVSVVQGWFELTVASGLKVQHYCITTNAGDGMGKGIGAAGDGNIYTDVHLLREHA